MKQNLNIITICLFLSIISCGGNNSNKSTSNYNYTVINKNLSGVAAIGAYLPINSIIELRSSSGYVNIESNVYDEDGNQLFDENGDPVIETTSVYKESEIISGIIIDNDGHYNIDITYLAKPYLIRVKDSISGTWYYSCNYGTETIANINPYTDWLLRRWYMGRISHENPGNINIDDVFTEGKYTVYNNGDPVVDLNYSVFGSSTPGHVYYGKIMAYPPEEDIYKVKLLQAYLIKQRYDIELENVITRDWIVGEPYDALLDDSEFNMSFGDRACWWLLYTIDIFEKINAYYDSSTSTFYCDLYTKYGNTKNVIIRLNTGYVNMTLNSTDENGVNHYTYSNIYTNTQTYIDIEIEDFSDIQAERIIGLESYIK